MFILYYYVMKVLLIHTYAYAFEEHLARISILGYHVPIEFRFDRGLGDVYKRQFQDFFDVFDEICL